MTAEPHGSEQASDTVRAATVERAHRGFVGAQAPALLLSVLLLATAAVSPTRAAEIEEPCTGTSDWVLLTSSEWLKGDLRRMRSRRLDFWSKEVKSRTIKWHKVVNLCMGKPARFVTEKNQVYAGFGRVEGDTVFVGTAGGEVSFPRRDLQAVLRGQDRELDRWGVRLGLGIDANTGNTNRTSFNASAAIRREDWRTRAEIEYTGDAGATDGVENLNRQRVLFTGDWYFSKDLYWSVVNAPFTYDKFQNIALRASPSTGPGWRIYNLPAFEWFFESAVGYQYTRFISVPAPQPIDSADFIIRLGTEIKWDITSTLEFKLKHDTMIVTTEIGLTSLYTKASFKYEIAWLLKLETGVVHNRIWEPAPQADGSVPKSDDLQIIVGFGLETY